MSLSKGRSAQETALGISSALIGHSPLQFVILGFYCAETQLSKTTNTQNTKKRAKEFSLAVLLILRLGRRFVAAQLAAVFGFDSSGAAVRETDEIREGGLL